MENRLDQWRFELRSPDAATRREAAEQIAKSPDASREACVALIDAIADQDDEVRDWVSEALEGMEAPEADHVAALIDRLADPDKDKSYWSATLLGRLGPHASPATTALAEALSDHESLATRERAAWALGKIGPAAKSALPALRNALSAGIPRLVKLVETAIQSVSSQ